METSRVTLQTATSSATPFSHQPTIMVASRVRAQTEIKSVQAVRNPAQRSKSRGCAPKVPWISFLKTIVNQGRAKAMQEARSKLRVLAGPNSCTKPVWVVLVTLVQATLRTRWLARMLEESCKAAGRWAARSIAGLPAQVALQPNTEATLHLSPSGRPRTWVCPSRTT